MYSELPAYLMYIDVDKSCMYLNMENDEFKYEKYSGKKLPGDINIANRILEPDSLPLRDFVEGIDFVFVSQYAYDCLVGLISDNVEFIKIGKLRGTQYFIMNVLTISDCLDLNISRLSSEKRTGLKHVRSCYFIQEKIPNSLIFKIPQDPKRIFVKMQFIQHVRERRLSGVGFTDPSIPMIGPRTPAFKDLPILG